MKKITLPVIAVAFMVLGFVSAASAGQPKICICHNTHSKSHPTETIAVALPAVCTHIRQHDDTVGACSISEIAECDGASQVLPEGFQCGECGGEGQDACPGCSDDSACDDGNPCTDNRCSPNGDNSVSRIVGEADDGCVYTPNKVSCDDGNACTTDDTCSGGECKGGSRLACDDENSCTSDNCDAVSGCTHEEIVCHDDDQCTEDVCVDGQCPHPAVSCDDGNACTDESCDAVTGCGHSPHSCDDGDACTDDSCNAETGCSYTPHSCDDGDPCTLDSCDAKDGCFHDLLESCGSVLAGCIALPGNSPAEVSFSTPKKMKGGVLDIPFTVTDPDGDHVDLRISSKEGSAEIVGDVIRFTLATPIPRDSDGLVEVTALASDSGSCQEKTFKTTVEVGLAGTGGCSLIR